MPPESYARQTFSQLGEDMILMQIFDGVLKRSTGFFVDVGAYHPWSLSNTALLYLKGWRGLNVDPNPLAQPLFETERPRDIFAACAISREEGMRDFWVFDPAAGSTLDPATRDRFAKKGWKIVRTLQVPAMPLSTLIARHLPPGTHIDYINIDVEGLDYEVLQTLDFERHAPSCISIETGRKILDRPDDPIRQHLTARGYTFFSHTVITSFFVKMP